MKTQREATYLIKSILSGSGFISDDSQFPSRRILSRLKAILSQLKHRNLAKGIEFQPEEIFTLDCIELTEVDRVSCPTIPPSGLTWKKSINPIPSFIKLISVTDILGSTSLPVIMWDKLTAHTKSRVKEVAKSPIATFRNFGDGTYLYALTPNKIISATIVPDDYAKAVLFPRCGEVDKKNCDWWDISIGAPDNLLSEAVQFLVADELKINTAIKPDQVVNDNHG